MAIYAAESRSLHLAEATSRARLFAEVIKPEVSTPECRPPPSNTRTVSRIFGAVLREVNARDPEEARPNLRRCIDYFGRRAIPFLFSLFPFNRLPVGHLSGK